MQDSEEMGVGKDRKELLKGHAGHMHIEGAWELVNTAACHQLRSM
jgi:hypothetical protein